MTEVFSSSNDSQVAPAAAASPSPRTAASNLVLRQATLEDRDFILEQILDCARNGHFDRRILIPGQYQLLYEEIDAVIREGRRPTEAIGAQALVFENGVERIGHAIMSEIKGAVGAELYAMALDGRWRGTGTGAAMLDLLIAHYLPRMGAIYARCFPRSVVMYELLISRGFEYALTTRAGLRLLRLTHPSANIPPLP